uniref:Uncharacterized protein n=1 Tax=viral metagenome TaxID=1070528 RepID=A0A6C0D5W7_9ZZZZ
MKFFGSNVFGTSAASKAEKAETEKRIEELIEFRANERKKEEESRAAALEQQKIQEKVARDREIEINAKISALSSDNLNKITEIFDKNDNNQKLLELKTKLSEISNDYNNIFRETVIPELIALVNETKIKLEKLKEDKPEITLTSLNMLESDLKELRNGNVRKLLAEEFNSDFLGKHLYWLLFRFKNKLQKPLNDEINKLTSILTTVPAPKPTVAGPTYIPPNPFNDPFGRFSSYGGSSKSSKKRRKPIKKRRNTKRRN